jgi:hypothetical protein
MKTKVFYFHFTDCMEVHSTQRFSYLSLAGTLHMLPSCCFWNIQTTPTLALSHCQALLEPLQPILSHSHFTTSFKPLLNVTSSVTV